MRPLGGAVSLLRQPSALSEQQNNKPEQRHPWRALPVVFSLHLLNFSELQAGDVAAKQKRSLCLWIVPPLERLQLQF